MRAEQWKHFATTGANIFTFDWEFAPRLSAAYDLLGNGRQKAVRVLRPLLRPDPQQHDAVRRHAHRPVIEEQLFINNQWVTYRTRGGAVQQDAFFAPTTQTPYTDDITIGYQVDLGRNMSFETTYTNRRTRDILEDYDLDAVRAGHRRATALSRARSTTRTRSGSAWTTSATPRSRDRTS